LWGLALGDIGPGAREAVPALSEILLTDEEATIRRRAAVGLGSSLTVKHDY
jgi:hypothetical protein